MEKTIKIYTNKEGNQANYTAVAMITYAEKSTLKYWGKKTCPYLKGKLASFEIIHGKTSMTTKEKIQDSRKNQGLGKVTTAF